MTYVESELIRKCKIQKKKKMQDTLRINDRYSENETFQIVTKEVMALSS